MARPADPGDEEGDDEVQDEQRPGLAEEVARLTAQGRVVASTDDEREPEEPEDGPRGTGSRALRGEQDRQDAAAQGTEDVENGVLDPAVELLEDRAKEIEGVHVEGKVQHAQVEEGRGDEPIPLAIGHGRAVHGASLDERAAAEAEEVEASRQQHVEHEDADVDGEDGPGHVRRVGGVGAAGAVELAPRGEVVALLLQEPADAVGQRPPLAGRRPTLRLAVRLDRAFELAVAHALLGDGAPSLPGVRPVAVGGVLPGGERLRLGIGPIASRADQQPGGASEVAIGVAGQRPEDRLHAAEVPGIQQALTFGEPLPGFIGHPRRVRRMRNDRREVGTSAVVSSPLARVLDHPRHGGGGASSIRRLAPYFERCRNSTTSS